MVGSANTASGERHPQRAGDPERRRDAGQDAQHRTHPGSQTHQRQPARVDPAEQPHHSAARARRDS